jgi:hypothetical protein
VISYDLENKIKSEKYIAEVIPMISATHFQSGSMAEQRGEVWIEDANGNKVDEATLSTAPDQIQ